MPTKTIEVSDGEASLLLILEIYFPISMSSHMLEIVSEANGFRQLIYDSV